MKWTERKIEVAGFCAMTQAKYEIGESGTSDQWHEQACIILDRWKVPMPRALAKQDA